MGGPTRNVGRMATMTEAEAFDVVRYACGKAVGDLAFHQTNSLALEVLYKKLFPVPNTVQAVPPGGVLKKEEETIETPDEKKE